MTNFFPSSQGFQAHGPSPSMQYAGPDTRRQLSPRSHEGTPSQSLGNVNTSNVSQFAVQGPTLPPLQNGGGNGAFLPSSSLHTFTPQPSQQNNQHVHDNFPPPMSTSAVDYHRPNEDVFHSYEPAQKPDSKNNKNSPRRPPAADSPDGTATSLNGRKRARTKVVAWDPEDLEDIYRRKEINREDWDAICKVSLRSVVIQSATLELTNCSGLPEPHSSCHATASHRKFSELVHHA